MASGKQARDRRQRRWRQLVRGDIEKAVVDLVTREGVAHLTMEKVAKAAGVAKGTLYLHYEDKEALLQSAMDAAVAPLVAEVGAILDADLPADVKLRQMADRNLRYFEDHRSFFRIFMYERFTSQTQAERHERARYKSIHGKVVEVMEQGMARGHFRRFDPAAVAEIWLEAVVATIVRRLLSDDPGPPEADVELLCDLFLHGLDAGGPRSG